MKLAGIQKLTLIDYPDKTACTLFTAGCNFACPFCHNPALIPFPENGTVEDGGITEYEILKFLETRINLLDAVCISGGEPLANREIIGFAKKIKEMGYLIKIDTNGSYPDTLEELVEVVHIDYIAMDVKNSLSKYAMTAGVPGFNTVSIEKSIKYLLTGKVDYEFRTTVVRQFHTADDIISAAVMLSPARKYYLQSFDNPQMALRAGLSAYSESEMQDILEQVRKVLPGAKLRGATA